jgi:hypothetical protein
MVLEEIIPGIKLNWLEGSMNELAESLTLEKLLARHNDPNSSFHMDKHQVFCGGHQYSDCVRFSTFSTEYAEQYGARKEL